MTNVASLAHRITLQQRATTEDAAGQPTIGWTAVATLWARVEQLSGRELLTANAERAENTARITIRYRSGIVENMRILHGAAVYDITSVSDITGKRRELEIMCKAGVSDG